MSEEDHHLQYGSNQKTALGKHAMNILVMQHQSGDRYRTVQYFDRLGEEGFSFENPHWSLKAEWSRWLSAAQRADLVWIARRLLSPRQLFDLQRTEAKILFDFDDALWLRSSRHGGRRALSKSFKFTSILEAAHRVVAGNDFLACEARRLVSANKVVVIPTVVNADWYGSCPPRADGVFTVGWIGSRATLGYLEGLRPVFEAFHTQRRPWKLKIVSDTWPDWPHLPVERVPWTLEGEERDLHDMDVGLNPLSDDDWSRGKCALKAIQTLAAGVPVLGSPVGVNCEVIREEETGFLCRTPEQWLTALGQLEADRVLARRLGDNGRAWMLKHYTMEVQAPRLAQVLRETVA